MQTDMGMGSVGCRVIMAMIEDRRKEQRQKSGKDRTAHGMYRKQHAHVFRLKYSFSRYLVFSCATIKGMGG